MQVIEIWEPQDLDYEDLKKMFLKYVMGTIYKGMKMA